MIIIIIIIILVIDFITNMNRCGLVKGAANLFRARSSVHRYSWRGISWRPPFFFWLLRQGDP